MPGQIIMLEHIERLTAALKASESIKRGYIDEVVRLRTALQAILDDIPWAEQIARKALTDSQ